jgi:hypothetical protein
VAIAAVRVLAALESRGALRPDRPVDQTQNLNRL